MPAAALTSKVLGPCMLLWNHVVILLYCRAYTAQQQSAACSPLALAAAALSILGQLAAQEAGSGSAADASAHAVEDLSPQQAATQQAARADEGCVVDVAATWDVLCSVFVSVAADVSEPQPQQALLRLCLEVLICHNAKLVVRCQPRQSLRYQAVCFLQLLHSWPPLPLPSRLNSQTQRPQLACLQSEALAGMRQRLQASQQLQDEAGRALVAISNQMVQGE